MSSRARRIAGRLLISVGLVVAVAAMAVGNMPDSALKAELDRVAGPIRNAVGLYQGWDVFAQPRDVSAYVDARVDYSDGTQSIHPISAASGLGAYVDYRWQKYEEMICLDEGKQYWPAYANYVAGLARTQGRDPVRVTLIRRWAATRPPGPGPERGPWQQVVMGSFPVGTPR